MAEYAVILMKRFDATYYPAVVDKGYQLTTTDKRYDSRLLPLPDEIVTSDPATIIEWAYVHAAEIGNQLKIEIRRSWRT